MAGTRRRGAGSVVVAVAALVAIGVMVPTATAAGAAANGPQPVPPGVGRPPAGSGINTAAAYANPDCDPNAATFGRINFVFAGFGPICTPRWPEGRNNGGATYPGVTRDKILVITVVPNDAQVAATPRQGGPMNLATGQPGTVPDAMSDTLTAYQHVFEGPYTYGRKIDQEFVVSTGDDEAAQRADAVTIIAKKPFVVIDATTTSLDVLDTALAAAKIPVFSLNATVSETLKQDPYRWGQTDPTSGTINSAEFIGKQLQGKSAAYAGDEGMHSKKRVFGLIRNDKIEEDFFNKTLVKYGVKIAPGATVDYTGTTSAVGDPVVAQEMAPTAIGKLKAAGVTSVILLADAAVVTALTKQATAQDYHPEWIYSGQNIDLPLLARSYDQDQWAHAFGISNVSPGTATPAAPNSVPSVVSWYWGPSKGTTGATYGNAIGWLMSGIQYAGPRLTPQTLKQGFFAVPATGGSASDDPTLANRGTRSGYGRTNGLPYEEFMRGNKDFTASWWDKDTMGPSILGFPGGQGTLWYLNDAKRYYAGHWPTKQLTLFEKSGALYQFDAPTAPPTVLPCSGCPSATGVGTPGAAAS
jgi:hypothetical protein